MKQVILKITQDFDYGQFGHFKTKKLEGIVSSKKIGLPLVDIYAIHPSVYRHWKKKGSLPTNFQSQLEKIAKKLLAKYGAVTLRTCFKFVGLENPRGLLCWRNLSSAQSVFASLEAAFHYGEAVAKKNKIKRFQLGLILMGRINAEKGGIIVVDIEKENLCSLDVVWGDAKLIAMGEGEWDTFWVDKKLKIIDARIGNKAVGYFFRGDEREKTTTPLAKRKIATLSDVEVVKLARYAFKAAGCHQANIEIEFMIDKSGVLDMYELQVRPGIRVVPPMTQTMGRGVLVQGVGTCLGQVRGKVRVIKKNQDLEKIKKGEIVVMHLPKADACLPIFTKAAAIITDCGGATSHFATIARDFNIPCVVGTEKATEVLKDGMEVMVDACRGEVRSTSKKFVAVVGMVGAGKTTASHYLEKKGFEYIRFGQVVMDEVKRKGLRVCEKNEKMVREGLRQKHGMAVMAKLNYPKIKKALKKAHVVADGLYSWAEYLFLKKRMKGEMIVLAIQASPQVRYRRMPRRGERALSARLAQSRDYADIAHIQKAGPIAMADYTIINEGGIRELKQAINLFLQKFGLTEI